MGLFDRFRSRVKEVAEETDLDGLTAEAGSDEAEEAIAAAEALQEEEWDEVEQIQAPVEPTEPAEEEWDEWDDEPEAPPAPTLTKKERKLAEREARRKEKERRALAKKGFDIDQVVRPDGSRVDLHVMRSTTGRKLVEVEQAPRKSIGKKSLGPETGT